MPAPQANAETFEQLSTALTGGMKLNVRAGNCFALVFMDGKLKESEAQQLRDFFAGLALFHVAFKTKSGM